MAKPAPHETMGELDLIRSPINMSAFPQADRFDNAAPDTGQDSRRVLEGFGLTAERIDNLVASDVVGE